jgi:signal transduction histidine kinase
LEVLGLIDNSLSYAGNIVSELLDYSREIRLEFTETTARKVTEAALRQASVPPNVTVRNLSEDTPRVTIDAAKTQRVFLNLIRISRRRSSRNRRIFVCGLALIEHAGTLLTLS